MIVNSIKQATAELKENGKVTYRSVTIVETLKRVNGWDEYTGRYQVFAEWGETPINDEPCSMSNAFKVAKPFFKGE